MPVSAPAPKVDPNTPWLYRGSDIPPDSEWSFGELSNGVRYAVRRNGVPPDQVSIRIRMDVGSMYELPSEMGFSHLLEHMVFRQSKYLGDGEAIPTWQRLGAAFGTDTNAQTGPLSTTFKLDLPNATSSSVDTSIKLLSGMMIAPTLSADNVAKDVPIVLAEKREGGGTAERVFDQTQGVLFAGQKFGSRPVIGTEKTLLGATSESVRAFHRRWYRPENAVIIVAGDISPAVMEAAIKKYFGEWKVDGPRTPEPPFGNPLAPKGAKGLAPVGQTRVIVEPDLPRSITYAIMRPWRPVQDTMAYNQGNMLDALAAAIINRRLEARARAGGSFLVAQVGREKVQRSADMTIIAITPLGSDWKSALADTRAVIADAMFKAPTQEEIDREVKEFAVAYESSVEQRRLQSGARLADDMVAALDIRETVASPEVIQKIFLGAIPTFTPANILGRTKTMFRGTVTRGVYITPAASEATAPALKLALSAPVTANGNARVDAKPIDFASLPPIGAAQQPVAARETGVLEIEQVDYANGVKVLLWPTTNEPGRVTLKVRFGAGYRAFNAQSAPYATLGNLALVSSGVGTLDQESIDKAMTGRKMGWDFEIADGYFSFGADTRSSDLQDQLYLFANKFINPRWDANPVLRAQAASKLSYDNYATSPNGVLERDLNYYARGKDPALRTPTPQDIAATSADGFRAVWEPILKQGPIEIQLFGDFKRDEALAAISKTFGALPARGELPPGTAPAKARTLPASLDPVVLYHRGDKDQAAAIIAWPTGGGIAGIHESRQLEILTQIMSNRVLDKVRERMGQSYSPQAVSDWPVDLDGGGKIMVLAQMKPELVPVFFEVADEIAADLIANPVSADELERVTEPLKQQLTRAVTGSNGFIMYLIEGATQDPARYGVVRSLLSDYTVTTPEKMQALAAKYLVRGNSWRLAVIPQGQTLGTRTSAVSGR
ncbi:insulinase family protein [Novosphingobium sp.]|uniref:M16 family metallopeptidase n=1 Tax=Novosphingobium sp. TaxID=1874826 RepID=UPI00286A05F2|nr:insulinase family protein [Novosphingobium sp.]